MQCALDVGALLAVAAAVYISHPKRKAFLVTLYFYFYVSFLILNPVLYHSPSSLQLQNKMRIPYSGASAVPFMEPYIADTKALQKLMVKKEALKKELRGECFFRMRRP